MPHIKSILRLKYSYGPMFWVGTAFLIAYYWIPASDVVGLGGVFLIIWDRVRCYLKRMIILEPTKVYEPQDEEIVELDISIPVGSKIFNRQRGMMMGTILVGFYSSYLFCTFVLNIKDFEANIIFYILGGAIAGIMYFREAPDLAKWAQLLKATDGHQLMLSNRAVYISIQLVEFSGRVSSLEKKFVLTSSGHIMLLWSEIESWLIVQRSAYFIGPPTYYHVVTLLNGRKLNIERRNLIEHETKIIKLVKRFTPVVIEGAERISN